MQVQLLLSAPTYTYNALNQLVKENDTVYKYDDAGNLISTTSSDKSAAYTYNAENKLIRATVNEAGKTVVEEYTYDYAGNRTSKTTGTETVKYLNDNSVLTNVLAELDVNGNELCYYTIGTDLISQERNGKTSLYLYDGHGSVRGLIDENGKVTDTYNYDAFGNLLDKIGTTVNNYLYCGEQFDSVTGLYYLRARYMNPATGTFITQDTYSGTIFDPTSLHKYLYANANPVTYSDPSGYLGIADLSISSAMGKAIDTIQNDSFALAVLKSFKAGFVCAGIDVYRQLRTNGAIDWSQVIETFFVSSAVGVVFGGSAILAATLKSAAIYIALGGSCFTFFGISLAQAQADGEVGYYDLMFLDLVFSGLSLKGAKNCFDNAYQVATASNTAQTSTNTSTTIRQSASQLNSINPRDYLEDALRMQNLQEAPSRFKHKWSENGYDYEVRIHEAETQYGKNGSIYRIARRSQVVDENGQGFGWEYLSTDGNWYHTSLLKPNSPNYNPNAAADTHIQL